MQQEIEQSLVAQSQYHNVEILYACEAGSRAWGFPSPDSDYDVRFIYIHDTDWYLSVFAQRDVIEQPINDLLDISGWDLRKTLLLLYKSNASLLEWLFSPIQYRQKSTVLSALQDLAKLTFQPLSVFHHYLAMAKKAWDAVLDQEIVSLKKYFYTLRALLCCEWISSEKTIPPVRFQSIVDHYYPAGEFREAMLELYGLKLQQNESSKYRRQDTPLLFAVIDSHIQILFVKLENSLLVNPEKVDKTIVDEVFLAILSKQNAEETICG